MLNKNKNILQCFQNSYLAVWHPLNLTPYYFGTIYFGTHKSKSIRSLPLVSQCPRDTAPYIFFIIFLYSYFIVFIFYKIFIYDTAALYIFFSPVVAVFDQGPDNSVRDINSPFKFLKKLERHRLIDWLIETWPRLIELWTFLESCIFQLPSRP